MYGLAAMDDRGRLADRAVLNALGWAPGTPLTSHYGSGMLALCPDPQGVIRAPVSSPANSDDGK